MRGLVSLLAATVRFIEKKPLAGAPPSVPEQLFNKIKRDYLFYFSRALNRVLVGPDMIQIMLTSTCNIRCKICDVWKQRFESEMSTEEVKSLIDQAIELGVETIYFTGGEALLRKDIFELIDYAARPGITTTVNTNGSFISEELAEKIVLSKLSNIQFSIDGANPGTHDAIRGEGIFEKALKGIDYINEYKRKLRRRAEDNLEERLDLALVSVIMKTNIEELPQLARLAKEKECCGIAFQPLINNGNLLDNYDFESDYWIDEEDVPRLERIFKVLKDLERELAPGFFIQLMPEKTIQHFKRDRRVNSCFAGFNRIFVNPQGDISFVCFPSFGSIKTDRVEEAWYSKRAFEVREKIRACKVNCTQFCSERTDSESLELIHRNLLEGIKRFPKKTRIKLLLKEFIFLRSLLLRTGGRLIKNTRQKEVSAAAVVTAGSLEREKIRLSFENGYTRLYYDDKELTGESGMHILLRYSGRWHKPSEAIWDVRKVSETKLVAEGKWLSLPLTYTFTFELSGSSIRCKIDRLIEDRMRLEEESFITMIPESFTSYLIPEKKQQARFAASYKSSYEWEDSCAFSAKEVSSISALKDDQTMIGIKSRISSNGPRLIISNTNDQKRCRALIFNQAREAKMRLRTGKEVFFDGEITINGAS